MSKEGLFSSCANVYSVIYQTDRKTRFGIKSAFKVTEKITTESSEKYYTKIVSIQTVKLHWSAFQGTVLNYAL